MPPGVCLRASRRWRTLQDGASAVKNRRYRTDLATATAATQSWTERN